MAPPFPLGGGGGGGKRWEVGGARFLKKKGVAAQRISGISQLFFSTQPIFWAIFGPFLGHFGPWKHLEGLRFPWRIQVFRKDYVPPKFSRNSKSAGIIEKAIQNVEI